MPLLGVPGIRICVSNRLASTCPQGLGVFELPLLKQPIFKIKVLLKQVLRSGAGIEFGDSILHFCSLYGGTFPEYDA